MDGPPVSHQTSNRGRYREWKEFVRKEAEKYWSHANEAIAGPAMFQINYFYDVIELDIDNIVKPIQDAINGLAYADDSQITDLIVKKRNLSGNFTIEAVTPTLTEGFARKSEFLHIIVTDAPDQSVLT